MASIIVAFPKAEDAKNIRNIIVRNGYQVAAVCVSGAQVLQAADNLGEGMVICSYRFRDMQYDHLKECLPRDFEMLLIASEGILDTCVTPDIVRLRLPLKVHDLMDTIEFMQSAIIRRQKKKKKMPKVRSEQYDRGGGTSLYAEMQHGQRNQSGRDGGNGICIDDELKGDKQL